MKKLQITGSLIIMLLLIIPFPVQAGEHAGVGLSLRLQESEIRVGDMVSAILEVDQDVSVRGAGITCFYDSTVLELIPDASVMQAPLEISGPLELDGSSAFRISFLPSAAMEQFSAEQALASICFRALSEADLTRIFVKAAYLYEEDLTEIKLKHTGYADLFVEPSEGSVPVQEMVLEPERLTMEEGKTADIKAVFTPPDSSGQDLIWTSSDETVARVSDGRIQAVASGQAVITAAVRDGSCSASCQVTVVPPGTGYLVEIPEDLSVEPGETFQIPVMVDHRDGESGYHAFSIHIAYDPQAVELVSKEISGMRMTDLSGEIRVVGYGKARAHHSTPFTLVFQALKEGNTEVMISEARIDHAANAVISNAPLATLVCERTAVQISKDVLPEEPEEDVKEETDPTEPEEPEEDVKEETDPTEPEEPEEDVKEETDPTEPEEPEEDVKEETDPTEPEGTEEDVKEETDPTEPEEPEEDVKEETDPTEPEEPEEDVKEETDPTEPEEPEEDVKEETDPTEPEEPDRNTDVLKPDSDAAAAGKPVQQYTDNAKKPVTAVGKQRETLQSADRTGNGSSTETVFDTAKGDRSRKIGSASKPETSEQRQYQAEICEYLNLGKWTMHLIRLEGKPDSGKIFTYDGHGMYYSEQGKAWLYLILDGEVPEQKSFMQKIAMVEDVRQTIDYGGCDVDMSGTVDIHDAELLQKLYNGVYTDFETIRMPGFLHGDVTRDGKIDVRDVTAVIHSVIGAGGGDT